MTLSSLHLMAVSYEAPLDGAVLLISAPEANMSPQVTHRWRCLQSRNNNCIYVDLAFLGKLVFKRNNNIV
jgi:hypothetical protein